jgi:P27 family predicted phage terminase small subunit
MAGVKGRSGPKGKANKTKLLSGSKHANQNAVEFETITHAEAPSWLDELARGMWDTICPLLCQEKILAVTDLHNVEAFCSAYSTFRLSIIEINENGLVVEGATGGPIKNPALTSKNEALRQMSSFGAALGLDPAARGRLMGGNGGDKGNAFGEF